MSKLLDKLRYAPDMRVYVVGAPAGFEAVIARRPKGVLRARTASGKLDLVHAFFTRKSEFDQEASTFRRALAPAGILWISYPKGKGLGTDLNRDVLREAGAKKGFEAVAQVAVDEVWSALRFKLAT